MKVQAISFTRRRMVLLICSNLKAVTTDTNCCRLFPPAVQVYCYYSQKIQINSLVLLLALTRTDFNTLLVF